MKTLFSVEKPIENSSQDAIPTTQTHIRTSVYKLFINIVLGLAGIDALYTVGTFFLSKVYLLQAPSLPLNFHHHAFFLMFLLGLLKTIIQFSWISSSIISWATRTFTISKSQLTHRIGLLNIKETLHDLRNLRSVTIHQSWLGKIFHFGDVDIEISASGGFKEFIYLPAIAYPEQLQQLLSNQSMLYTDKND